MGVLLPIVLMLIFAYAAYWAFAIRRSLAVRLYRNQSLGVGLIALGPLVFSLELLVTGGSPPGPGTPLLDAIYIATGFGLTLLVFYWIDASVLAARRGDPLLRDSFHWRRLRLLLWIVNIAGIAASSVGVLYAGFGSIVFPPWHIVWGIGEQSVAVAHPGHCDFWDHSPSYKCVQIKGRCFPDPSQVVRLIFRNRAGSDFGLSSRTNLDYLDI